MAIFVALSRRMHARGAQAELTLGNNRNAMRDALRASQLNPDNMKVSRMPKLPGPQAVRLASGIFDPPLHRQVIMRR